MTLSPALHSSAVHSWNTPQEVLDALAPLGGIALDPCSNPTSLVDAWFTLSLEGGDDGLAADWLALAVEAYQQSGRSLVYVNSPYGRELGAWMDKCADEAARGCEIVALPPARTDTRWWSTCVQTCDALATWRGRLRFSGADAGAPFPSALIYWGHRPAVFVDAMRRFCTLAALGRHVR